MMIFRCLTIGGSVRHILQRIKRSGELKVTISSITLEDNGIVRVSRQYVETRLVGDDALEFSGATELLKR